MNAWQLSRQIKFLLKAATWTGGSGKVLGSALITAATDSETFGALRNPFCLISPQDAPADRQDADFYNQVFAVAVGVIVAGGQYGEEALIGGPRASTTDSSDGRGLLEVEEEVLEAIGLMTGADGVNAACVSKSAVGAALVQDMGYVAQRVYRIECVASRKRYYHPPQDLAKATNTVSWRLPPSRFDYFKVRLFRKAGATAPTYEEVGATEVTIGTPATDTSVTDATSGEWTYAIFALYDETHTGTASDDQRQSQAGSDIPGTTLTVT